ncbi:hypothetical protein HH310_28955 [Actinoplanes sp. TBRC 11911]|uniref:hypothetical protein n=1 Tax=Actinoplanes sp. TBRC 11911 TaxID=2729386 RepID=UPI00145C8BD0|nr:hypothetical protein [Actinoplanes sp. TBRC 11911]NMO55201.1 hypothetical protein [Actinoplanes sp. TBRC 11911]
MGEPIDDELRRMTGNPKVADAISAGLRQLTKGGAGPELAEMARDLLAGRISLRDVGRSSAYGPQLVEAFSKFRQWQIDLSPEERERIERQTEEQFGDAAAPDHQV